MRQVSIEDYLAKELGSQVKHEYIGGATYMMAGARNAHSLIASNLLGTLHHLLRDHLLRDQSFRPYNSDTKIRVPLPSEMRFYYPDVSVIRDSNPLTDSFQDRPIFIAEVLSQQTRRIDEGEKKDAFMTLGSLSLYLLLEQDYPEASLNRRTEKGFVCERYTQTEAIIPLPEIGTEISLSDIYDGVEFKT